ncbi:MAG: hypothetical protein JWL77_2388 [Chthonomonadaceae bacterium]|nr:hypothetical protein [Chthonomonadaceae bacterium]
MERSKLGWLLLGVLFLGVLFLGLNAPALAQESAIGQVLRAQGKVVIWRAKERPIVCVGLDQLQLGDTLSATSHGGSATVVLYKNGARFVLTVGSSVRVEQNRLFRLSGPIPQALTPLNLALIGPRKKPFPGAGPQHPPEVGPRYGGSLILGPPKGPFDPWPDGAVRQASVTLRWEAHSNPDLWRLQIVETSSDTEMAPLLLRRDLPATIREFPVEEGLLKPGLWYRWSVTAVAQRRVGAHFVEERKIGQVCEGIVRVLLPDESATLKGMELEAEALNKQDPKDPTPYLLLGEAYEQFCLPKEAISAYKTALQLGAHLGAEAAIQRLADAIPALRDTESLQRMIKPPQAGRK